MAKRFSIDVLGSFAELRKQAPELAIVHSEQDFFCTLPWFETLGNHGLEPDVHLQILLGTSRQEGSIALPLLSHNGRLRSLSNFYSGLYGPLTSGVPLHPDFLRLACRRIRGDTRRWPVVEIRPVATEDDFAHQIAGSLREVGYWTDRFFCFGNWYLEVAERSFSQYHSSLSSRLRNTIARSRAKLTREGNWSARVIVSSGPELETAIRNYVSIYSASWKPAEPFVDFIPALCRMAADNGWLRLGLLTLHGKAIAAQIWIVKDGTASIYKLTYDEHYGRLSPGTLLSAHMMQHCIDEDHVHTIDYLSGDDGYKKDWMSHRRERIVVIAFDSRTFFGLTLGLLHYSQKMIKRLAWPRRAQSIHRDQKSLVI